MVWREGARRSARLVPAALAREWMVCPVDESDRRIVLAAERQPDPAVVIRLRELAGRDVEIQTVAPERLTELLAYAYESAALEAVATVREIPTAPRVLLAEDDDVQSLLGATFLGKVGFTVVTARDGQDALDRLCDGIDAVATDLDMPRLCGEQLVRAIRAAGHDVPIIVLPGRDDPSMVNPLLDAGASDYFRKPLDPTRFPARIRAAVIRRSMTPR